ncbi:MAG: signal peptidase I [Candidatus Krumholzibacteriota bacterium]|nr:signal peptidase I [Candidatus Krumholzibacteriota bacterium]
MQRLRREGLPRTILFYSAFVLIFFCIRSSVFASYLVPTPSMNPTILEGDFFYANKLAYRFKIPFTKASLFEWSAPKRGDIVVFKFPENERSLFTKRVIGVAGDRVEFVEGRIYINGRKIEQDFIEFKGSAKIYEEDLVGTKHYVQYLSSGRGSDNMKIDIPEGYLFVMGDNRENSYDSRHWGMLPLGNVEGKIAVRWFSFDLKELRPRFDRIRIM